MLNAILMTLLATTLLSLWVAAAGHWGWLQGPATVTIVAWAGQLTPALAAVLMRYIRGQGWHIAGLSRATRRWYAKAWAVATLLGTAAFVLSVPWGWGSFATSWSDLAANIGRLGFMEAPAAKGAIAGYVAVNMLLTPIPLSLVALGEEIGWRGYLLPQLAGLGRRRALIVSGLLWSVWHIPLVWVGQAYPGHRTLGLLLVFPFITAVGIILGYYRLESNSVFVSSVLHGTLNAQMAGLGAVFVAVESPVYGGLMGISGIIVLWAAALWILSRAVAEPM